MKTHTLQDQFLIVSDPPHGELDVRSAAPCVGLTPTQVRSKANYTVPEIWVADRSRIRTVATAQTLRLAGHKLTVVRGSQLLVPSQTVVKMFRFENSGIAVNLGDGREMEIPYDAPVTGVLCKPRRPTTVSGSHNGSRLARAIEPASVTQRNQSKRDGGAQRSSVDGPNGDSAFLDLYVPTSTGLIRVTFSQHESDFTGLGSRATDRAADNLMAVVRECESRLVSLRLDRRLEDMLPRRPTSGATTLGYSVVRRGYSFASVGLPRLLCGIHPGLEELNQFELSSRLAYLTAQSHDVVRGS